MRPLTSAMIVAAGLGTAAAVALVGHPHAVPPPAPATVRPLAPQPSATGAPARVVIVLSGRTAKPAKAHGPKQGRGRGHNGGHGKGRGRGG